MRFPSRRWLDNRTSSTPRLAPTAGRPRCAPTPRSRVRRSFNRSAPARNCSATLSARVGAPHNRTRKPRHGRFFLDALIAIALLSVAGLAVTASTRALATLADDALLVAHAQAAATSVAEHAIAQLCDTLRTQPPLYGARLTVTSSTPRNTPPTQIITARATPSPLSIRDSVQLSLSTARQCP